MLVNERIWIEKKPGFTTEAEELKNELKENLHISVSNLRYFALYDVFNIEASLLEEAKKTVFSEVMVDREEQPELTGKSFVAYESLPGQYDQRADAAMQCIRLLDPKDNCSVTTGKVVLFDEVLSEEQLKAIASYLINPIESRIKDLNKMEIDRNVDVTPLEEYPNFINYSDEELHQFIKDKGLAMSFDDIKLVQEYFKSEGRNPRETEVRVLDTYWSDHCRHT
ncbi:MAG: phosphoribosylformylglycinamidine synthase, partial [Erysipelotrichaceae bacterium]|nr:phosphoribosylformylglycinamidine synthase [Erysipelotrichaceae bacterium]